MWKYINHLQILSPTSECSLAGLKTSILGITLYLVWKHLPAAAVNDNMELTLRTRSLLINDVDLSTSVYVKLNLCILELSHRFWATTYVERVFEHKRLRQASCIDRNGLSALLHICIHLLLIQLRVLMQQCAMLFQTMATNTVSLYYMQHSAHCIVVVNHR